MTTYEILKVIVEIVKEVCWPLVVITIVLLFRKSIKHLLSRLANIEGSLGSLNFKLQAKEKIEETVKEAINLEKQGKKEEAEKLIANNTEIISQALGLTENDIKYLIAIKEGKGKGRWGKVNLVNAGLVELDGGKLTEAGQIIIERFLRHNSIK